MLLDDGTGGVPLLADRGVPGEDTQPDSLVVLGLAALWLAGLGLEQQQRGDLRLGQQLDRGGGDLTNVSKYQKVCDHL